MINRAEWFARSTDKAAERGTVIHALLSAIAWLEPGWKPEDEYEAQCKTARRVCRGITDEECDRYIHDFYHLLASPVIRELLTRPEEACEAGCEESFVCLADGKIINGQYDRVIYYPSRKKPERIALYDYKTDTVTTAKDIKAVVKKYTPQMILYVQSLQKNYGMPRTAITAYLVLTKPGKIVQMT
jgi:ATP-dependent exoDNAse (exonuclease V) beta subunit